MFTLIAGIAVIALAVFVAVSTGNPIGAIPLVFVGGCLLLAGLFSLQGGMGRALEGLATIGMRTCGNCDRPTARNVAVCKHCGAREQ